MAFLSQYVYLYFILANNSLLCSCLLTYWLCWHLAVEICNAKLPQCSNWLDLLPFLSPYQESIMKHFLVSIKNSMASPTTATQPGLAVPANFFGILRCMPDKSLQPSITFFIHFSSKSHLGSHKHSMGKSIKRGRQKKQVNASLEYPALWIFLCAEIFCFSINTT